ncbi:glycosyltransferase family 25 protein [Elioraea tepidiphila]|uniref:glycosyltransferase family 25 protein n=1 Tax=Elioraea tepidiphila TaxID=457934 RepID=UPI0009FDF409|nr:glycosyltransferase family 25 protein [Elioraea tepidiphila]
MHIFVINLEHSEDRRDTILSRVQALGLFAEVFTAIDGRSLDLNNCNYDGRKRRLFYGKDMTPGEIGCAQSHLAVYREIVRRDLPYALVLEDDAVLVDSLPYALQSLEKSAEPWDLVRFLGKPKDLKRMRPVSQLSDGLALTRIYGTPGGAYGYVLSKKAAGRMADCSAAGWMPIDTLHGQVWCHGLRVRGLVPPPVLPDLDAPSTIGEQRFSKSRRLHGLERAAFPFTRFGFKLFDAAAKTLTYRLGLVHDYLGARRKA